MSAFVWIMMGIAIWHFTVFVPDKFWGGIVGAFVVAMVGSLIFGLIVSGFHVPGRHDTHLINAIEAIPGALIALGLSWVYGKRLEEQGGRKKRRRRPAPRST
jgi:uncharacterized membrane protein YeaQ/YmgE (transglycosylase-associated protein family)